MHDLGRMYADGLGLECDEALAQEWYEKALSAFLTVEAAKPNRYVEYRVGWMLLHGIGTEKNETAACGWFKESAAGGNPNAQFQLAKIILADSASGPEQVNTALEWLTKAAEAGHDHAQYALGKLYLLGKEIPQDRDAAIHWFTLSAAQGNEHAQYFLDHRNDFRGPSAFTCATQLLHHLGRLFQDLTQRAPIRGITITDRKLRRRIQEKKIAMGHKADDHENAGITMQ